MRSAENLDPALDRVGLASAEMLLQPSTDMLAMIARSGIRFTILFVAIQVGVAHADFSAAERQNQALADHLASASKSTREAQKALDSGQVDLCAAAVKQAKQSCKQVVGILTDRPSYDDLLGKPMNETLRALRDPRAVCEPTDDKADRGKTLAEVSNRLERLASASSGRSR